MSFNDRARLDKSQVRTGSGGRATGIALGGGVGGLVLVALFTLLSGGNVQDIMRQIDISQLNPGDGGDVDISQCETGADANEHDVCRIIGTVNSAQDYWSEALPRDINRNYREATTVIFSGSVNTACGAATSASGPFYCPADEQIYIDAGFFQDLHTRYGSDGGTLAQMYVVAHEYGHHVQHVLGILSQADRRDTGPTSDAVRVELMADCLAGVWAHHASRTTDSSGQRLIEPLTERDIRSALSAAAAVGDDRLQEAHGGSVNHESWTHGSSEQRQRWFLAGYEGGTINHCDTFAAGRL